MENQFIDRELLKQQRKQRKKEKKEAKRLQKQKEQDACALKGQESHLVKTELKFNKTGEGLNRHIKSKAPIQVSLESCQKTKEIATKKYENKNLHTAPYLGNSLDSSHPERYKGKYREKPKAKKFSKLKSDILENEHCRVNDSNETNIINYCDNLVTEHLNNVSKEYVKKIVQLQDNAFLKDPIKAKIKKRYVLGFHELKKKLIVGKIKFFIIAADIKIYNKDELLYKIIEEIILLAQNRNNLYTFALKRSKLGNLCKVYRPVSCFGVLNHQGAEEEFKKLQVEIHKIPMYKDQTLCEEDTIINQNFLERFKEILISEDDMIDKNAPISDI